MWTCYAKDYIGLVIGFDEQQFQYFQKELLTRIPLLQVNYVEGPITDNDFTNSFELKYPLGDNVSYNYADCMSDEKAADALFRYICCMKKSDMENGKRITSCCST